jgi:hypothetical protein
MDAPLHLQAKIYPWTLLRRSVHPPRQMTLRGSHVRNLVSFYNFTQFGSSNLLPDRVRHITWAHQSSRLPHRSHDSTLGLPVPMILQGGYTSLGVRKSNVLSRSYTRSYVMYTRPSSHLTTSIPPRWSLAFCHLTTCTDGEAKCSQGDVSQMSRPHIPR